MKATFSLTNLSLHISIILYRLISIFLFQIPTAANVKTNEKKKEKCAKKCKSKKIIVFSEF